MRKLVLLVVVAGSLTVITLSGWGDKAKPDGLLTPSEMAQIRGLACGCDQTTSGDYTCKATFNAVGKCFQAKTSDPAPTCVAYTEVTDNSYKWCKELVTSSKHCDYVGTVVCMDAWEAIPGAMENGYRCNSTTTSCSVQDEAYNCIPCSKGVNRLPAQDYKQNSDQCVD